MSTMIVENPDSGAREYLIPSGWANSVTTFLKVYPKQLDYAAGLMGVTMTADIAHEVAQEYAATRWSQEDFDKGGIPGTFLDFGYAVLSRCKAVYGTAKNGNMKPPHKRFWGAKADVGTAVHLGFEGHVKHMLGQVAPIPMDKSPVFLALIHEDQERAADTLRAVLRWADETDFTPLASEVVCWLDGEEGVRNRVACRLDLPAIVAGVPCVLDLKTGKLDGKKPYHEQMIQTEIQRRAWNARGMGPRALTAGILHVPAAGGVVKAYTSDTQGLDPDLLARQFDACADLYLALYGEPTGKP